MKVNELIERLKQLPQDYEVVMADYAPVVLVKADNTYGDGVVFISDICELDDEE